jgi:DNA-binding protein H-NS
VPGWGRERKVRKWEYKKIALNEVPRGDDDIDVLCDAGEQGWELVSVLPNGVAYLKREMTDSAPETAERRSEDTPQAAPTEATSAGSSAESASHVKPKYRDPATGDTWSGRGRMAIWLKRKQDAGEDIEHYLVQA